MGGGLRDIEKEVQNVLKELVTATTILNNHEESLQAEVDAKARLISEADDASTAISAREADLVKVQEAYHRYWTHTVDVMGLRLLYKVRAACFGPL
jgi:hypothetical protein